MAKAYLVGEIEITDPAQYEQYRAQVPATLAPYGGRFLVRGGEPVLLEGDRAARRFVILEFDSPERASAWYHSEEYSRIKALRLQASSGRIVLLTGVTAG